MKQYTLNDNINIPAAGFGVFQIKDEVECIRAVKMPSRLDTA